MTCNSMTGRKKDAYPQVFISKSKPNSFICIII